jgi:cell division protease FtsH
MGHAADYSLEVAREIDEEVRALVEAAHTEAWDVLQSYRDVLDLLVAELVEKETLHRKDLERIFGAVQKRPRITAFNDFGGRTPSDKPPIKTPGELAKERGEPWPPVQPEPEPTPVGAVPGGGLPQAPGGVGGPGPGGPNGAPPPRRPQPGPPPYGQPPGQWPGQPQPVPPPHGYPPQGQPGTAPYPPPYRQPSASPGYRGGPPNYGAPPDWRPATTPAGRPYQVEDPLAGTRVGPEDENREPGGE